MTSAAERITSIIDTALRTHQRLRQMRERRVEKEAEELSRASREGSVWLSAHVVPLLLHLRRGLVEQGITVEIDDNLAPEAHLPAAHFAGPSVSMRLLRKDGARPAVATARYIFHCDGEFLNIARQSGIETRPLGMPFAIDSNPREAEEIVLQIIRRTLSDYYRALEG